MKQKEPKIVNALIVSVWQNRKDTHTKCTFDINNKNIVTCENDKVKGGIVINEYVKLDTEKIYKHYTYFGVSKN